MAPGPGPRHGDCCWLEPFLPQLPLNLPLPVYSWFLYCQYPLPFPFPFPFTCPCWILVSSSVVSNLSLNSSYHFSNLPRCLPAICSLLIWFSSFQVLLTRAAAVMMDWGSCVSMDCTICCIAASSFRCGVCILMSDQCCLPWRNEAE